jgi:hypothetical protein
METTDTSNFLRAEAELVLTEVRDPDSLVCFKKQTAFKARRVKSQRTKTLGNPIQLPGMAWAILIRGGNAWIAENTTVARKIELEVGQSSTSLALLNSPVV